MKRSLYLLLFAVLSLAACRKDHKDTALPLAIRGFLPSSGNPGTVVTIRGTGFSSSIDRNAVSFNGTDARIIDANDTMLIVQAPEKGTTGPVAVTSGGRTIKADTYTYQALSIHGISPANGPEGTNISISGAGFAGVERPAEVTVNGHAAIVSNANDTLLVIIVPAGAGSGPLEVSVNGEHAAGPAFTFQSITKIKPAKGGAGTQVTITGTGFSTDIAADNVAFNGIAATVMSATATSLVVKAPENVRTGPVSLTINGQKTAGPVFTVVPAPSIRSVAPLSGPVGTMVTITGDNFSDLQEEDTVTINSMKTTIVSVSAKQLVLTVPAGTTSGLVRVGVNGQGVTGPQFTVQQLGISKLLPDNGLDGTVVTMKGTGFDPVPANNQVTINGMSVTVTAATDTTLTVVMPVGVATGTLNVTAGGLSATGPVFRRSGVSTFYTGAWAQNNPTGMVTDSKGNIFVARGNQIGKITPDAVAVDFAGSSTAGNKDGTGTGALFSGVTGMTIDAQDNLYVADAFNYSVRKITPNGTVSTIISGLSFSPRYIAIDPQGNLYVGSEYNGVYTVTTGGELKRVIFGTPPNQFAYYNSFIYFSNADQSVVFRGNIAAGTQSQFTGISWQGGYVDGPPGAGMMNGPGSMVYDRVSGLLYFVDAYNYSVRAVSPDDGAISTITGAGGTYEPWKSGYKDGALTEALFRLTSSSPIAVDKNGNIYVIDPGNSAIRKITMQ